LTALAEESGARVVYHGPGAGALLELYRASAGRER
jgi:hypothetical protein